MSFKTELHIKTFTNSKDQLTKPFYYYPDPKNKGNGVTVPKGFVTDYASIPRLFLPLIPKIGRTRKAAVLHDYLYSIKYDRKEADDIFLSAMTILEVKPWRKYIIYFMVRCFGWLRYSKNND